MPLVRWTLPAANDLRAIDEWLSENAGPEPAIRTLAAIGNRAQFLTNFPHGGRPSPGGLRVLRVWETRYLILYRIAGEAVEILRIHHEREDWLIEP
jgi:toxin ParE1/3/4